jgi:hypothetical protein
MDNRIIQLDMKGAQMVDLMIKKAPPLSSTIVCYKELTIVDLAELIAENSDKSALDELLSRCICSVNGEQLTVCGYLLFLKENRKPQAYESVMTIEAVYNLSVLKFCSFSDSHNNGPDCRRYYRAFLKYIKPLIAGVDVIEEEIIAAEKLKAFAYRQFRWSYLDARRKENGFSKLYYWNGYKLQMPSVMTGRQCAKWLKDNIGQSNIKNASEQQRLQQIIDENLFVPSIIPLAGDSFDDFKAKTITPLSEIIEKEVASKSLSECIANEKADNLDSLRVSIARLGKEKVQKLVVAIFDAISTDSYKPSVLGARFGVSPAAMTRFASLKWKNGNGNSIPQLWANTARYVVNLPQYSKMLYETGLYNKLSSIVLED